MKKLDVFSLGEHGVNRVKSPIHIEKGELLNSQNANIRLVQAQLGLSKRDGMAKINTSAAAGTLLNIHNIPILDPQADTNTLLYTARFGERDIIALDGNSFQAPAALETPVLDVHNRFSLCTGHDGDLYIAKSGAVLNVWDGTTLSTVSGTPSASQIQSMWFESVNERLYCGMTGTAVTAKVAYYDGSSWTTLATTNLGGDQFTGLVAVLNDGSVFAYTQNQGAGNNHGRVLLYNGTSWDTDMDTSDDFGFTSSSLHGAQQLWTDGTDLYACFENDNNDSLPNLFIFKRDSAGTWTNISPTTISRDYGFVTAVCVDSNDNLYAGYHNEAGTSLEIWKRDPSGTWTIDFDILADEPGSLWSLTSKIIEWEGDIYATPDSFCTDYIIKKSLGGSWAQYVTTPEGGYAIAIGPEL